jgi:hypothetical protein
MLMFYWCFIDYWYLVIWLLIIDRVFYLVGGLEHLVILFPYIGNVIIPTDFHIFQMGWNHQPVIVIMLLLSSALLLLLLW